MDILGPISWTVLTVLSSLPVLYWYLTRNFKYWTKRGLKGPNPLPIVGTNLSTVFNPMPTVEVDWFQKFGKLYGIFNKTEPILTVAEPDLIKTILVKDFHLFSDRKVRQTNHPILDKHLFNSRGEDWKRYRSIMSPTFTSGKMKKMFPMIRQCLTEFLDHLEDYAKDRKNINLKDMHGNFTMDVIATCAFATKTNAHKEPNNPFIVNAKKVFEFPLKIILPMMILPKPVLRWLNIRSTAPDSSNEFFLELTRHLIRQRKSENNTHKKYSDFVQLLVDSDKNKEDLHDEGDKDEAHHLNEGEEELAIERKTLSNISDKNLTEEEMMAQGWIFFIAGYETTATTLTFCSYEMALNPEVQDRLYEEVQLAVDSDGEISYEKLAKLPFLDSVISETLRLYPPVLRLERKAQKDYKLGDTGIQLFKGQEVEIPVYAIHHSEDFYPNANQFYPDRFMPENRHNIIPYTYLPFGAGPRNCIGMRFALMEIKLGLAQIVRRFRFFRSEQTAVPLEFRTISRLCAAKSVVVGIENRV